MVKQTAKLAIAGVGTALALIGMLVAHFLPVRFSPLLVCSVCYYIVLDKSNIVYALLSITASLLLMFAITGLGSALVLCGVVFAPYAILCYYIRKIMYGKSIKTLWRILILAVFVQLAVLACYGIFGWLLPSALTEFFKYGYWIVALVANVLFYAVDILFVMVVAKICPLIKIRK